MIMIYGTIKKPILPTLLLQIRKIEKVSIFVMRKLHCNVNLKIAKMLFLYSFDYEFRLEKWGKIVFVVISHENPVLSSKHGQQKYAKYLMILFWQTKEVQL